MTAPRQIIPGRTSLITRRCTQRQFLLRPDKRTNEIFAYCLAEAAQRFEIELIAWVAMSNHYHAVVRDPLGKLPAFLEHFHKMTAKALNHHRGRQENFWSSEETCITYLPTAEDIFEKVIYVLLNPVAAGLVERVSHWPGCTSLAFLDDTSTVHGRPEFFARGGVMPSAVGLRATFPRAIRGRESQASWMARIRRAIASRERGLADARRRKRTRVIGAKRIVGGSPFATATSYERLRNLRPAVACRDPSRRVAELKALTAFQFAYRAARRRFVVGEHDVEFPAGTYQLRRWGACCAPFSRAA